MWTFEIVDKDAIWREDHLQRWSTLLESARNQHVFFHPQMVKAWIDTYMPLRNLTPIFVWGTDDCGHRAFMPLVLWGKNWKNACMRSIVPVGYSDYDYHDPISDTGIGMVFYSELKGFLGKHYSFDEICLDGIRLYDLTTEDTKDTEIHCDTSVLSVPSVVENKTTDYTDYTDFNSQPLAGEDLTTGNTKDTKKHRDTLRNSVDSEYPVVDNEPQRAQRTLRNTKPGVNSVDSESSVVENKTIKDTKDIDKLRVPRGENGVELYWTQGEICPRLVLDGFDCEDDLFKFMKTSLRGDIRRQMRRLNEVGELNLKEYHTNAEAMKTFDHFMVCHRKRWSNAYKAPHFHENLLKDEMLGSVVHFSSLNVGDTPVAWHLGFEYGGRYYYYMPAGNPDFLNMSPVKVHLFMLMSRAIKNGLNVFDHLRGDENYKQGWSNEAEYVNVLRCESRNITAKLKRGVLKVRSQLLHI